MREEEKTLHHALWYIQASSRFREQSYENELGDILAGDIIATILFKYFYWLGMNIE